MKRDDIQNIYSGAIISQVLAESKGSRLRFGQAMMNELFLDFPDVYAKIAGTDDDCFYEDSPELISRFVKRLETFLDKE